MDRRMGESVSTQVLELVNTVGKVVGIDKETRLQ